MASAIDPHGGPFVGPRPLAESDEALFFGRDDEVADLSSMIAAHSLIVLCSASGAGKTSLLRAGVLPRLPRDDYLVLPVARVPAPEAAPSRHALAARLLRSLAGEGPSFAREESPRGLLHYLQSLEPSDVRTDTPLRVPVLVLDQAEELFLAGHDFSMRRSFLAEISAATRETGLRVIFSIRDDAMPRLMRELDLAKARSPIAMYLSPLMPRQAEDVIVGLFAAYGVSVQVAAAKAMVRRLRASPAGSRTGTPSEYVEPLHLQVWCRALWKALPPGGHELTVADIANQADPDTSLMEYYASLVARAAEAGNMRVPQLRHLIQTVFIDSQAGVRLSRPENSKALEGLSGQALRVLVGGRLLQRELRGGEPWLELAHDRLVAPILRSNEAAEAEAEAIRTARSKRLLVSLAILGLLIGVLSAVWAFARGTDTPNPTSAVTAGGSLAGLEQRIQLRDDNVGAVQVAVSADRDWLATVGADGRVRVWDATSGSRRVTLPYESTAIFGVAFHPSGAILASAGDSGLLFWKASPRPSGLPALGKAGRLGDGIRVVRISPADVGFRGRTVRFIAFTLDGDLLLSDGVEVRRVDAVALADPTLGVRTVAGLRLVRGQTLPRPLGNVLFSDDGRFLVGVAGDRTVEVHSLAGIGSGTLDGVRGVEPQTSAGGATRSETLVAAETLEAPVRRVAISGGAKAFALTSVGRVHILDIARNRESPLPDLADPTATSLAVSDDGRLIALGSDSGQVRILSDSGTTEATLSPYVSAPADLAFIRGTSFLTAADRQPTKIWSSVEDGATGKNPQSPGTAFRKLRTYPGAAAGRAQIAQWMAALAFQRGLPPELPVMAALAESDLNPAHQDSQYPTGRGLFNMRTDVWDRGAYAGFASDPLLQVTWFLDSALSLQSRRVSQGFDAYGTEPADYVDWIIEVQRPPSERRGRFENRLAEARRLIRG